MSTYLYQLEKISKVLALDNLLENIPKITEEDAKLINNVKDMKAVDYVLYLGLELELALKIKRDDETAFELFYGSSEGHTCGLC